jgi:hypothetical protein
MLNRRQFLNRISLALVTPNRRQFINKNTERGPPVAWLGPTTRGLRWKAISGLPCSSVLRGAWRLLKKSARIWKNASESVTTDEHKK